MNQDLTCDLTGKIALVTGASRGIGRVIARAFALAGAEVILSSRQQSTLDAVVAEIQDAGGSAWAMAAHTGNPEDVANLFTEIEKRHGGIDILVNNAATNPHFGSILTATEGQWDKILDVNLKGYFRVAKAAVSGMRQRGGGKMINMASVAGRKPLPGMGVYCVSKAAVIMLTEVLALELAPDNIQVNGLAPGFVKTQFSRVLWEHKQVHDAIISMVPQKRMAVPEEMVGAALFLAGDASRFVTGTTLVLDGGQLLASGFTL